MMPAYDWYLVWNEAIKEDLLRIYPRTAAERVLVTGTPQFDFHFRPEFTLSREEFCARVGADPARPIVLYSTGIQTPMPEEPRIVEGVARALQQVRGVPRPQLLVRVYPKDLSGRFDALRDRQLPTCCSRPSRGSTGGYAAPGGFRESVHQHASPLRARHQRRVDGLARLCMFDKPVLNIGYDPPGFDVRPISYARYYRFDHYKPVVDSGAVSDRRRGRARPCAAGGVR